MSVDLARNDSARICKPGSRYASDLVEVDKYSYVMPVVSKFVSVWKQNEGCTACLMTGMNMGTLTGALKVRAMQSISELWQKSKKKEGGVGRWKRQDILQI